MMGDPFTEYTGPKDGSKSLTVSLPPSQPSSCDRYEEFEFDNAKDFFDAILNFQSIASTFWPCSNGGRRWLYRGHWDANWKIEPTAFRQNPSPWGKFRSFQQKNSKKEILLGQIEHELFSLVDFMSLANDYGIECNYSPQVFEYVAKMRESLHTSNTQYLYDWPDPATLPVMAMAQHYGLPTRLLDFSFNPLTSAFFASNSVFCDVLAGRKERDTDGKLCIWAVHEDDLASKMHREPIERFWKIPAETRQGHRLHAQSGLLVLDREANKTFQNTGKWPDFLDIDDGTKRDPGKYPIKKLTLPQRLHKDLLKLLYYQRITPASIMPTLDKIVETMQLKKWLE